MVIIFLTKTGRIWQVQLDMHLLPPTRALSNRDVMTLRPSVMSYYTCSKDHFHGKVYQDVVRMRNMLQLRGKRLKFHLRICAVVIHQNLKSSWNIVDHSDLNRNQTTRPVSVSFRTAWKDTTSTPRYSTILGNRIDCQKTKRPWKQVSWISSRRNPKRKMKRITIIMIRATVGSTNQELKKKIGILRVILSRQ